MPHILLFGGTGNLGKKIAEQLHAQGLPFSAVVRHELKAEEMRAWTSNCIVADVTRKHRLDGITDGFEVVISALGKSVSLNDRSSPSFQEIDLHANNYILGQALKSGVSKFVYVSAFHAERYQHLEYFRVHHLFSEKLKASGIDYSIIKPPALYSAFLDLIDMAGKGRLVTLGKGDKKTNPIWEGDLARIVVASLHQSRAEIEAGGPQVLTRKEINEVIQKLAAPRYRVRSVPLALVRPMLSLAKLFSRNTYDKLAFFLEVLQHDTVAPQLGEKRLEEYVREQVENKK